MQHARAERPQLRAASREEPACRRAPLFCVSGDSRLIDRLAAQTGQHQVKEPTEQTATGGTL
jgi:hypothetical protein